MEVSVLQAALIGISCWLGSVENSQPLGVAFSALCLNLLLEEQL